MAYTVKQLAALSNTSVRTLHWYDEIGLLKPAHQGANGYRYYEEKELLRLQQILFFKELGFPLSDIQSLLSQKDFDNIEALYAHKKVLEKDIDRKQHLIETIDKTIEHLRGKITMSDKELYYGFDSARQKEYEQFMVKSLGTDAEKHLEASKRRTAKWDKEEWDSVKTQGDLIHKALASAIEEGLKPEADEVQAIIHQHYQMQNRFYDFTKEGYIALTDLYAQHPDFKKFFDVYHSKMINYITKAIRFYAEKNL